MRRISRVQHHHHHQSVVGGGESIRNLTLSEIAAALQETADATKTKDSSRNNNNKKVDKVVAPPPSAWVETGGVRSTQPLPPPPRQQQQQQQSTPQPSPAPVASPRVSMPTSSRLQLMASLRRRAQHHHSTTASQQQQNQQQQVKPPQQAPTPPPTSSNVETGVRSSAGSGGEGRGTLPSDAEATFRFLDLADLAQPPESTTSVAKPASTDQIKNSSNKIHLPQYESSAPPTQNQQQPLPASDVKMKEQSREEDKRADDDDTVKLDRVNVDHENNDGGPPIRQPYYKLSRLEGFQLNAQPLPHTTTQPTPPPPHHQQQQESTTAGFTGRPQSSLKNNNDDQHQSPNVVDLPKKVLFDLTSFSKYINGGAEHKPTATTTNTDTAKQQSAHQVQAASNISRPLVAGGGGSRSQEPPHDSSSTNINTYSATNSSTATSGWSNERGHHQNTSPSTINGVSGTINGVSGKASNNKDPSVEPTPPSTPTWIDQHIEKFIAECTASQKQQDEEENSRRMVGNREDDDEGDALIRFSPDFFAALISSNNVVKHIIYNHFPKCRQSVVSNNMDIVPTGYDRSGGGGGSPRNNSSSSKTNNHHANSPKKSSSSSRYVMGSDLTYIETALHCTLALSLALHCEDVLHHQHTATTTHHGAPTTMEHNNNNNHSSGSPVVLEAMGTRITISEPSHNVVHCTDVKQEGVVDKEEWDGIFSLLEGSGGGGGDTTTPSTPAQLPPSSLTSFSDISECIGTLYTVFRGSLSSRSLGTLYKHALSHPSRPILKYMASVGVIAVPNQNGQAKKADDANESSTSSPSIKSAVDEGSAPPPTTTTNATTPSSHHKFPLMFDPYSSLTFSIQRRLVATLLMEESLRKYWLQPNSWKFPASISLPPSSSGGVVVGGGTAAGHSSSTTNPVSSPSGGVVSVGGVAGVGVSGIVNIGPEILFAPATAKATQSDSTEMSLSSPAPPEQPTIGAQSIAHVLHNFFLTDLPDDLVFEASWATTTTSSSSSSPNQQQQRYARRVNAHGLLTSLLVEQLVISTKEITAYMDTLQDVTAQLRSKSKVMKSSNTTSETDNNRNIINNITGTTDDSSLSPSSLSLSPPKKLQKFALHSSLLDFLRFPPTTPQRQSASMDRVLSQPFYPTHYRSPLIDTTSEDHTPSSSVLVSKHKDRRPVGAFTVVTPPTENNNNKTSSVNTTITRASSTGGGGGSAGVIMYVQNFTTHAHILHCISKVWGERGVHASMTSLSSMLAKFWVKDQTSPYNTTTTLTTTSTSTGDDSNLAASTSSSDESPSTTTIHTTTVSTTVTLLHSMVFNVLATHYASSLQLQKFVEATRNELDAIYQLLREEESNAAATVAAQAAAVTAASGVGGGDDHSGPETQRSNPSPTLLITKRGPQEGMRVYSKLSEVTLEMIRSIPHANQGLQLAALQEIANEEEFVASAIEKLQQEVQNPTNTQKVEEVNLESDSQVSLFDNDTTASASSASNVQNNTPCSSSPHSLLLLNTCSLAVINSHLTSSPLLQEEEHQRNNLSTTATKQRPPSMSSVPFSKSAPPSQKTSSSIASAIAVVDSVNWTFLLMALTKNPYIHIGLLRTISPQFTIMTHLTTTLMHNAQESFEKVAVSKLGEVLKKMDEDEEAAVAVVNDSTTESSITTTPTEVNKTPPPTPTSNTTSTTTTSSNSALFSELVKLGTIESRNNNNDANMTTTIGASTYHDIRTRPFSVSTFASPVTGNVSSRLISVIGIIALLSRPDVNIAPPAALFRAFGNLILSASGPVLIPRSEALYSHLANNSNATSNNRRRRQYDAAEWNLVCTSPLRSFAVSMPPEPFRRFLIGINLIQIRTMEDMILSVHTEPSSTTPTTTGATNQKCAVTELWDTQLNPASHKSRISTLGSLSTVLMFDWEKLHLHGRNTKTKIVNTTNKNTADEKGGMLEGGGGPGDTATKTALSLCPPVLYSRQHIEASIVEGSSSTCTNAGVVSYTHNTLLSKINTPTTTITPPRPPPPPYVVRALSPILQFIHSVQSPVNHAALQWQVPLRVLYSMRQYTADAIDNYRSGKDCRHYLYARCSDEDITPLTPQQQSTPSSSELRSPTILTNTPPFVVATDKHHQSSQQAQWPALKGCTASGSGGRNISIRAVYDMISELTYILTLNSETYRTVDSASPFESIAALTTTTTTTTKTTDKRRTKPDMDSMKKSSDTNNKNTVEFELAPASLAAVLYAIAHISPQAIHQELSPYLPHVDPTTGNTITSRKPIPKSIAKRLQLLQSNISQLFSSAIWVSSFTSSSSKSKTSSSSLKNNMSTLTGSNAAKLRSSDLLRGIDDDVDDDDVTNFTNDSSNSNDRDDRPVQQQRNNSESSSSSTENSATMPPGGGNSVFVTQFSEANNLAIKTANRMVEMRNALSSSAVGEGDDDGSMADVVSSSSPTPNEDDLEDELLTAVKEPSATQQTSSSSSFSGVQLPHVGISTAMLLHLAATSSPPTQNTQPALSPKTLAHKFTFHCPSSNSDSVISNGDDYDETSRTGNVVPDIRFQCSGARTGVSMQGGGMMRHFSTRLSPTIPPPASSPTASTSPGAQQQLMQQQHQQLPPFWERIFGADTASRAGNTLLTTTPTNSPSTADSGSSMHSHRHGGGGKYSSSAVRAEHFFLGRHSRWGKINELLRVNSCTSSSSTKAHGGGGVDGDELLHNAPSPSSYMSFKVQESRILKLMPHIYPTPIASSSTVDNAPTNTDHHHASITTSGVLNLLCARVGGGSGQMGSSSSSSSSSSGACLVSGDELLARRRLQNLYKAHVPPEGLLSSKDTIERSTASSSSSSLDAKNYKNKKTKEEEGEYVLPEGPMTVPQALEALRAVEDKVNAAFDMISVVLYLDSRLHAQQRSTGKTHYQRRHGSDSPPRRR